MVWRQEGQRVRQQAVEGRVHVGNWALHPCSRALPTGRWLGGQEGRKVRQQIETST